MKKIVTILGARPQFIKASVVSKAIEESEDLREVLVHTGQHYDSNMSSVFFSELGMQNPDYNLNVNGGSHGAMTGRMLERTEEVLLKERPDVVLVYGDTNSTIAGALAAVKMHIPVAHVEAGLRSFNLDMPEEINRILTDRISRWLFAPTRDSVQHLMDEGISSSCIYCVGDVMYDVALHHGRRAAMLSREVKSRFEISDSKYVLATIHRAENTDNPRRLSAIVEALATVGEEISVIWPIHPRTLAAVKSAGLFEKLSLSVRLTEPLGYLAMVALESCASVIATDSGGVQKEAFFHSVPCVTLRDETEWTELVSSGWNKLVRPISSIAIKNAIIGAMGTSGENIKPYGEGQAAKEIVKAISSELS